MANEIFASPRFKRLYKTKRKRSSEELMKRVDAGINELRNSERPEMIGDRKRGELFGYYSYEISRGHRILYRVERKDGVVSVLLHRVCDHKNVYGED